MHVEHGQAISSSLLCKAVQVYCGRRKGGGASRGLAAAVSAIDQRDTRAAPFCAPPTKISAKSEFC